MQYICINSITMHQRKITHRMVIPTNLEEMNRGSQYLVPSKMFLAISVAIGIRHSVKTLDLFL